MAPRFHSTPARVLLAGLLGAAALVGGAVLAGRLPREAPDHPGLVLDALPRGHFDGPTRAARDAERGLAVTFPEDGSCLRDAAEVFVCHYPRLELGVAWHVDALLDERDVRAELSAARQRQLDRRAARSAGTPSEADTLTDELIVRVGATTGVATHERCATSATECKNELSFVGWRGEGERKIRLMIEAAWSKNVGPEVAWAVLGSTLLDPPPWASLRPQGKSPELRPELQQELGARGVSRDGSVSLPAPTGATCKSDDRSVRCYGRRGFYATVSATDLLRASPIRYPSTAGWLRAELGRYRASGKQPPGELYVLSSFSGFAEIRRCDSPPAGSTPCRHRILLRGVPTRDEVSALVTAEISVIDANDLELGWAVLDAASVSRPRAR